MSKKGLFLSKSDTYWKINVQIDLTGPERGKNEADLCKSLDFNHTNEIYITRAPREEERWNFPSFRALFKIEDMIRNNTNILQNQRKQGGTSIGVKLGQIRSN